MMNQDIVSLLLILAIVVMAILFPPGPGTPLRDRVQQPANVPTR